jgi:hypothetical protein
MQSADLREKHNLQGSCIEDMLKACFCACCTLVQAEKESAERVGEVMQVKEQYRGESMVMGAQK